MKNKTLEQEIMEARYHFPYNWMYPRDSRRFRAKLGLWRAVNDFAGDLRGKRALDVGCGDGWYTAQMVEAGGAVTGLDYSERAIGFARLLVPGASFKNVSAAEIPFEDKSFDIVFSIQVLEHIPPEELPRAVGEIARVLKNGGRAVISVPSVRRKFSTAHFRHFTYKSLETALSPYLKIEKAAGQWWKFFPASLMDSLYENRFWFSPVLARFINKFFFKYLNETTPERGENLVVLCSRK